MKACRGVLHPRCVESHSWAKRARLLPNLVGDTISDIESSRADLRSSDVVHVHVGAQALGRSKLLQSTDDRPSVLSLPFTHEEIEECASISKNSEATFRACTYALTVLTPASCLYMENPELNPLRFMLAISAMLPDIAFILPTHQRSMKPHPLGSTDPIHPHSVQICLLSRQGA